jgi:hypothetical protein
MGLRAEPVCNPLFSVEQFLALEAAQVSELLLVFVAICYVRSFGRVE